MLPILVFDVNETLLDLTFLNPHFERIFGDKIMLREWFNQVILFAQALTITDQYRDFAEIARAALHMTAEVEGKQFLPDDSRRFFEDMRRLPPHNDVVESLSRLREAGVRMVTLTNSPPAVVEAQMEKGGLRQFFERSFSVDTVRKFKPAPEPYRMVAENLGVETTQLMMVAAHAWDIDGAMRVGYSGAFVARPGKALFAGFPKPQIVGKDLLEVSEMILRMKR
jgi:2-haloacid dehalogenase